MSEKREDILAKILNLCESNPDAGLEFIEYTMRDKPESESDPFGKFAKAMAYGSKGLFQLSRSKPQIDFTLFNEDELRENLGITDIHLDYLVKGLQEIKQMEEIYPGASKLFGTEQDKIGESKIDVMAMVLERCRPGSVQEILGKTKLIYSGPERIKIVSRSVDETRVKPFLDIFFKFRTIIRAALVMSQGSGYILCSLYQRTLDGLDHVDGATLSEKAGWAGTIYSYDDGTFHE